MNKNIRRIISILLMVIMILSLCSCNSNNAANNEADKKIENEADKKAENVENTEIVYPYTITDQAGREVQITKKFERAAMSSVRPVPSVYFAVTGNVNTLVGMNPSSMSAAKTSMFGVLAPDVLKIETGFVEGNNTNIEELLKLKPEVVFCLNKNTDEIKALEAVGITAIGMETNGTDPIELFSDWAELIGNVMGEKNNATAIIDHSRNVASEIKAIGATIPEAEKKKVMFLYTDDGNTIRVAGSNLYSQYWIESIGAINVAAELNNVSEVNMEQIYQWNPDYIFITNFTDAQPSNLLENTFEGQDWSKIKAVQDKNVYKNPLGVYRWFTPSADGALMLKWIAQKVYPDYYKGYDMNEEIKNHYSKFYNYNLSEEELNLILNPSSDAAYYVPSSK